MREAIATAPRDGNAIILEDDASGTYDVGHWSAKAGTWISEKGEPSKITPSHWYPMPADKYLRLQSDTPSSPSERGPSASPARRLAVSSMAAALLATALVGIYFRADVADYGTRYAGLPDNHEDSRIGRQVVARAGVQQDAQVKEAVEAPGPDARSFEEKNQHKAVLGNEVAEAKSDINGLNLERAAAVNSAQLLERQSEQAGAREQDVTAEKREVTASAVPHGRAVEEEHARSAALASELATARREIETNAARLDKARDNAEQVKQTAERTEAELRQERARAEAASRELAMARREIETNVALLNKARDDGAQFKLTAETTTAELKKERDSAEASSRELAVARRETETYAAALNKARDDGAQFRKTAERTTAELQQERARAEASARELEIARLEIKTNAAALNAARDDAAQFKQTAERTTAELQQERARAEASARELAVARREIETSVALNKARDYAAPFTQTAERTTEELQQERARAEASARELAIARREIETNVALLKKARDDAAQFKQTAERMTAALRQVRARAQASSRELSMASEPAQRAIDARPTPQPTANSQIPQATHAGEAFASKPPVAGVSKGDADATKLMARARALLGQGNIAAARIVLESAAQTGSPQASFTLAETYDPIILAAWGTHGTRGDATKARQLYTQAHAGGIQEAKKRVDALDQ